MIYENMLSLMLGMIWINRRSYKEDKIYLYIADMVRDYSRTSGTLTICLITVTKINNFYNMAIYMRASWVIAIWSLYLNWFLSLKCKMSVSWLSKQPKQPKHHSYFQYFFFLPCKYQWTVKYTKSRREKIIRLGDKKLETSWTAKRQDIRYKKATRYKTATSKQIYNFHSSLGAHDGFTQPIFPKGLTTSVCK